MLGDILRKVIRKKHIPPPAADRRLIDLWRRAVGPQIAARTFPDNFKRGTLYVRVAASVWLHQLQFMKEEILRKINDMAPKEEIKTLFFSIGEIPAPPPSAPAEAAPAPLRARDRNMMKESLDAVRDPELREIMERVMVREISRRRELEKRKAR